MRQNPTTVHRNGSECCEKLNPPCESATDHEKESEGVTGSECLFWSYKIPLKSQMQKGPSIPKGLAAVVAMLPNSCCMCARYSLGICCVRPVTAPPPRRFEGCERRALPSAKWLCRVPCCGYTRCSHVGLNRNLHSS